jgi:hypothetical protein
MWIGKGLLWFLKELAPLVARLQTSICLNLGELEFSSFVVCGEFPPVLLTYRTSRQMGVEWFHPALTRNKTSNGRANTGNTRSSELYVAKTDTNGPGPYSNAMMPMQCN